MNFFDKVKFTVLALAVVGLMLLLEFSQSDVGNTYLVACYSHSQLIFSGAGESVEVSSNYVKFKDIMTKNEVSIYNGQCVITKVPKK